MASEFFLRILIGIPVRKAADFDYCQLMEHDSSDKNYIANCSSLTQITPSILPTTYVILWTSNTFFDSSKKSPITRQPLVVRKLEGEKNTF